MSNILALIYALKALEAHGSMPDEIVTHGTDPQDEHTSPHPLVDECEVLQTNVSSPTMVTSTSLPCVIFNLTAIVCSVPNATASAGYAAESPPLWATSTTDRRCR